MNKSKIIEIAADVQKRAEEIHSASAVFAVENMLNERWQEIFAMEEEKLSIEIKAAADNGDDSKADELQEQKRRLINARKRYKAKIHINYDNLSPYGARLAYSDGSYTIVLSEQLQETIREGICRKDRGKWTPDMKMAKNTLRHKTVHELLHVICESFHKTGYVEEDFDTFADELLKMRNERFL